MCRGAHGGQAQAQLQAQKARQAQASPRCLVARPDAPTPEQTNYWLRDMDRASEGGRASSSSERAGQVDLPDRSESPDGRRASALRPRSPTPTKMLLAWEDAPTRDDKDTGCGSGGDSDHEGRGDHTDGLIAKLIEACQKNDVQRAFSLYESLRRMRVPLYEGVYKLIIECCMRTQQLGHAMQFYETLKGSGQRVSSRLVIVLMEACAKEQHGDKVHAIWNDWCPSGPI